MHLICHLFGHWLRRGLWSMSEDGSVYFRTDTCRVCSHVAEINQQRLGFLWLS